jgi:gliding motility-associated-like protein
LNIEVIDEVLFYAPNTFTPNGDESNNVWVYYISNFYDFEIEVYNRWGERIWESTDANDYWDGTYKGVMVQDGTYTWKVKVTPLDSDDKLQFVGHVTVLK